jgi:predicted nucleotide-binding protein
MAKSASKASNGKPRSYVSQTEVPRFSVTDALRVANALADEYGKQPTRPLDVAKALKMSPNSSQYKLLTGASVAYGFTDAGAQAEKIGLTPLGRRAIAPTEEGDDVQAMREGFLRPRVVRDFLKKYDGSRFPSDSIALNVLEEMGVPAKFAERTRKLIADGAEALDLLTEIKGKTYVNLDAAVTPGESDGEDEDEDQDILDEEEALTEDGGEDEVKPPEAEKKRRPNRIFLGHGKNKKPLTQLTKTLDQLGIPYKVAEEEPNLGRPISTKVRQTMSECGAGILIFTADREYQDKDGNPIWLSSENVANELGAAAVMYDDRIIIFKEEGVELASNYSGIGYITFAKDKLDAKVPDLLRELVAMKILKVSVDED